MGSDSLKFASAIDACSYLSELMGGGRIIIGSVEPKKGDMVIFYHPKEGKFFATKFPGRNAGQLSKKDVIAEFDDNANEEKIGQEMRIKFLTPWFNARKTVNEDNIPSFIWANSIDADHDLEVGDIDFALDERASAGSARTRGRFQKRNYGNFVNKKFTKEGNIKSFKKNPRRMMKKVKNKSTEKAMQEMREVSTDLTDAELDKMFQSSAKFASIEEAIQFLADITEATIKIQK